LDELPVFSGEILIEFCSLLRKVLSHFPTSVYKPPARERRVMSVTWRDSERNGDAEPEDRPFDLWTFPNESRRCQSSPRKEGFWCYTCGITEYRRICIACAELRHHGRDVLLATFDSGSCYCGTNCLAPRDPLPPIATAADRPTSGPAESVPTPCSGRSSSSYSPPYTRPGSPSNQRLSWLSVPIEDLELKPLETNVVRPALRFQSEPDSVTLANVADAIAALRHESESQFIRRSSVSALQLIVVAGTMSEFLVVSFGESLVAYRSGTLEEVARTRLPHSAVSLAACLIDPALFAFASRHHIIVYSVSEAGFSQAHEIELILDSLGSHIIVSSVEWILNQPLLLVVVCNVFVKIYVPVNVICPYLNFAVPEGDFFTLSVFALRDEEQVGLFATVSGQIALQSLTVEGFNGPPWFTTSCRARPLPFLNSH
jgi:hypothetical protein